MKLATFNVNSIRSRMGIVVEWLEKNQPDVLCLQETRVSDDKFPAADFEEMGYHPAFSGSGGRNGVAIITKSKPKDVAVGLDDGGPADADRLIRCSLGGVHIVNTYVPQGRDVTLPVYQYKLQWLSRLAGFFERHYTTRKRVLWCGDLNVAPTNIDVHDPKRLEGHVCFNPEVRAAFQEVVGWGLVDVFRQHHADEPGLFTFYDYRAPSALKRNKGWRIDHILATKPMARRCVACDVDLGPRRAERPSDHTVLIAEFAD